MSHLTIWPVLKTRFPSETIGWPEEAPAGVIPLLFITSKSIDEWANLQLDAMKLPSETATPATDNHYKRAYDGIITALTSTAGPKMDTAAPYLFRYIFNGTSSASFWANFPSTLKRFPELMSSTIEVADKKIGEVGRRTNLVGILVNHLSRQDEGNSMTFNSIHITDHVYSVLLCS